MYCKIADVPLNAVSDIVTSRLTFDAHEWNKRRVVKVQGFWSKSDLFGRVLLLGEKYDFTYLLAINYQFYPPFYIYIFDTVSRYTVQNELYDYIFIN